MSQAHPIKTQLAGTLFFAFCAWKTKHMLGTDMAIAPMFLALLAGIMALRASWTILWFIPGWLHHRYVMRAQGYKGTAGWSDRKAMKRTGLHKPKGFLLGMLGKAPVFADIEAAGMVLSPAGGGKTVGFVIPALAHNAVSMLVPDLKGILAVQTAVYRRRYLKHKTFVLNPAGLHRDLIGAVAAYNPLQLMIDSWADKSLHGTLLSDAQGMARQLLPEPKESEGNVYFRNGSRKLLVFCFLYLVTEDDEDGTLTKALEMLCDLELLRTNLLIASTSETLSGDLARIATDLLQKMEAGRPEQFESFREGAVQVLDVYAASGTLAACTALSSFRFRDLKDMRATVYVVADPTRMSVYGPWLGLISWCAMTELVRYQNGNKVTFLLDEVTNFRIEGLPKFLTLAREFQISCWLILQELEQFAATYGREGLETLLSQTEVKVIHGSRSQKTTELVSSMLGEYSYRAVSYALGQNEHEPVKRSVAEHGAKLLTSEEVRRFEDIIILIGKMRPIAAQKIGYHEVAPWARRVAKNPLFKKHLKGKIRLRLKG